MDKKESFIIEALGTKEGKRLLLEAMAKGAGEWFRARFEERMDKGYYDLPFRWWKYDSPWEAFVAEIKEIFGVE